MTDIDNEQDVKRSLSRWLESYGFDIYWERDVSDYPRFTVSGTEGSKPDLLIEGDRDTIALEVKNNQSSSNVYDANPQVIRYWKELPDAEYRSDGDMVDIDAILAATQDSQNGHLFSMPLDAPREEYHGRREDVIERGDLPLIEHRMTEQFTRVLWRYYNEGSGGSGVYVGALLSGVIDGGNDTPAVLWNDHSGVEKSWRRIR